MSKMPTKIKIGAHDWAVVYQKDLKNSQGRPLYGEANFDNHVISLADDLPSHSKEAEVLIHEVIHSLLALYGTGLKSKDEEQVCLNLGQGLAALIKDNPKLVKYLTVALK